MGPWLPWARQPGGCPEPQACALGTLYLLGRGQERACPAAARAAGQSVRRPGGRHASRSSPAGHSWIPDKGLGRGEGSEALFAFSPPALSQQLSVPQRAPPGRRALSGSRLPPQTPLEDALSWPLPRASLVPGGGFAQPAGWVNLRVFRTENSATEREALAPSRRARGGGGQKPDVGTPSLGKCALTPGATPLPLWGSAFRALFTLGENQGLPRRVSLSPGDFCLGVRSPLTVPWDAAPNFQTLSSHHSHPKSKTYGWHLRGPGWPWWTPHPHPRGRSTAANQGQGAGFRCRVCRAQAQVRRLGRGQELSAAPGSATRLRAGAAEQQATSSALGPPAHPLAQLPPPPKQTGPGGEHRPGTPASWKSF